MAFWARFEICSLEFFVYIVHDCMGFRSLKEGAPAIRLSKSSYLNARYDPLSIVFKSGAVMHWWLSTNNGVERVFLHENTSCRLEFHSDFRYFGTQISNIFYLIHFWWFFSRGQLPGAENPRCRSQNPNLTNEAHSVLGRTFICAIGHQKRIIIREDGLSFFCR